MAVVCSAYLSGCGSSSTTSSTSPAATPTFSPIAGSYTSAQTVTISDSTPGAVIYYTTNGTTPTTSSNLYRSSISVTATETIEAIATATGYSNSDVASATYTIEVSEPSAATPTFSPIAGSYTSAQTVTISDSTPGAVIYYTTNGTTPTTNSDVYGSPISVTATETIEAIATATGYTNSGVASATYTIEVSEPSASTPTFTPAGGTYTQSTLTMSVTIIDATSGAAIYYTTDGSTPTYPISGTTAQYTAPITVSPYETVQAIATASGYSTSAVGTAAYVIQTSAPLINEDFNPSDFNGNDSTDGLWVISGPWVGTGDNYLNPANAALEANYDGEPGGYLLMSVVPTSNPFSGTCPDTDSTANPCQGAEIQTNGTTDINGTTYNGSNLWYGYYETRMKVTSTPGVVDSFFWKMVNYGNCEIDYEFLTDEPWASYPTINGDVHLTVDGETGAGLSVEEPLSFNPTTGFHRYGILWTPTQLSWIVDGTTILSYNDPPTTEVPCSSGGYIMMNTWTGNATWGGGPPTSTATSVYDWVKYWPGVTSPPD
jgi:hypothetical protein